MKVLKILLFAVSVLVLALVLAMARCSLTRSRTIPVPADFGVLDRVKVKSVAVWTYAYRKGAIISDPEIIKSLAAELNAVRREGVRGRSEYLEPSMSYGLICNDQEGNLILQVDRTGDWEFLRFRLPEGDQAFVRNSNGKLPTLLHAEAYADLCSVYEYLVLYSEKSEWSDGTKRSARDATEDWNTLRPDLAIPVPMDQEKLRAHMPAPVPPATMEALGKFEVDVFGRALPVMPIYESE